MADEIKAQEAPEKRYAGEAGDPARFECEYGSCDETAAHAIEYRGKKGWGMGRYLYVCFRHKGWAEKQVTAVPQKRVNKGEAMTLDEGSDKEVDWEKGRVRQRRRSKPPATPRARRTDPATSHEAAASIKGLTEKQRAVYTVLSDYGPMTDEQLAEQYEKLRWPAAFPLQSPSGLRTRRRELADRNLVREQRYPDNDLQEHAGELVRVKMSTGRLAQVWEVVPGSAARLGT
jgi:hypothetical protein